MYVKLSFVSLTYVTISLIVKHLNFLSGVPLLYQHTRLTLQVFITPLPTVTATQLLQAVFSADLRFILHNQLQMLCKSSVSELNPWTAKQERQ